MTPALVSVEQALEAAGLRREQTDEHINIHEEAAYKNTRARTQIHKEQSHRDRKKNEATPLYTRGCSSSSASVATQSGSALPWPSGRNTLVGRP